jgi:hypothetical protein
MIRFGVFGVHDAHITPQTIIPGSSYHFNDSHVWLKNTPILLQHYDLLILLILATSKFIIAEFGLLSVNN